MSDETTLDVVETTEEVTEELTPKAKPVAKQDLAELETELKKVRREAAEKRVRLKELEAETAENTTKLQTELETKKQELELAQKELARKQVIISGIKYGLPEAGVTKLMDVLTSGSLDAESLDKAMAEISSEIRKIQNQTISTANPLASTPDIAAKFRSELYGDTTGFWGGGGVVTKEK